jgi:hypothetical protein
MPKSHHLDREAVSWGPGTDEAIEGDDAVGGDDAAPGSDDE